MLEMKLLDLAVEYAAAKDDREGPYSDLPGHMTSREPGEIATEYGQVLKQFLAA